MKRISISVNDLQIQEVEHCLESQCDLPLSHIHIDAIESKQILQDAIVEYESAITLEDFYQCPPWVICDYLRMIYLADNEESVYLDHDIEITDPDVFMCQLESTGMEINKSTGLFNNGIICNKYDCELFHQFLVYWMKQPITTQIYSAAGFLAKKNNFGKIDKGFNHSMYSLNSRKERKAL